jgi:hypothetical protein
MDNFMFGLKNDMVANMATRFARGVLRMSSFLGNLKPSDEKLNLRPGELQYEAPFVEKTTLA